MNEIRRWRTIALLSAGLTVGIALAGSPAVAHVGGWLHNWNVHLRPKADARYLPGGELPPGKTVRGSYWMGGTAAAGFEIATSEISFGYRMFKAAPQGHFIEQGETPPAACPGSHLNPRARAGHLCIYERVDLNAGIRNFNGPGGDSSTYRFGAGLFIRSAAAGTYWSIGTWAATSGTASAPSRAPSDDTPTDGGVTQ